VLCFSANPLFAQATPTAPGGSGGSPAPTGAAPKGGFMEEFKAMIGALDNVGALAILAILIWKLPSMLQVMNESKENIAKTMKEAQDVALRSFQEEMTKGREKTDQRYERLETAISKLADATQQSVTTLTLLTKEIERLKKD
jgi:hypothetical protein